MIFVTVGTHEQQFNRLVEYIDKLKEKNIIEDEVIMQTGFCTYTPKFCKYSALFDYSEMINFVSEAKIVVTHGGPSSFVMPLQIGKTPIVVPRRAEFEEHVNDHQFDFSTEVAKRQGNIIVVDDINNLENTILNFDEITANMPAEMKSNNAKFNEELNKIVNGFFGG